MALVLYAATAAGLLWLAHRFITPLDRFSAAILILLPLCFTGRALLTGGVYAPLDLIYVAEPFVGMKEEMHIGHINGALSDVACQMLPWRAAVRNMLARGTWPPLWNPYILSGDILAATAQPAVYSPFTLIACLLPPAISMTYTAAILHFIAALAAFLFARELGCRSIAAWFAAGGWALSTALTIFILWPDGHAFALFPFVLLGTRRVALQPGLRSAAILTSGFTLMIVSGHPETLLHTVTLAVPYGMFLLLRERRNVLKSIVWATASGVIALLLTTIQLLPMLEAIPQSMEYQFRHNVWAQQLHSANAAESRARLMCDLFPYLLGRHWRDPTIKQNPFDSWAAGSLVLALAIYGLWRGRGSERWFLAAVFLFGVSARMALPAFATLMRPLPGLNIAINERFAFAGAFALAVLAAVGLEAWLSRDRDYGIAIVSTIVLGMLAASTWYLMRNDPTDFPAEWTTHPIAGELIPLLLAVAVLLFLRARVAVPVMLLLLVAQRYATVGTIYPTLPARVTYPDVPLFAPLRSVREPFRITGTGAALIPGTAAVYALEDVRGYEAMTFSRYVWTFDLWCKAQAIWFNRVDDLTRPFLSFLNVRYAITGMQDPPAGWHVVGEDHGSRLLENERVLPRAFIPKKLVVGTSTPIDTTFAEMQQASDFSEWAWIEAPMSRHERTNGPGTVSIEQRKNGFRFRVVIEHAGWVIVSEPAWKGWRAYIDGRRVQIQIANQAFLGIYVPEGAHNIRLIYLPESFVIGRVISATTLAALIILALLRGRLQRFQPLLQRPDS